MPSNEAQFIIEHLGQQIGGLSTAIEASRAERQKQIESIRVEMQVAHGVLHKRISDSDGRLRALEISHAANIGKCEATQKPDGDSWLKNIGGIDGKSKRVTGLVALALVTLIGLAIIIWGPSMVQAIRGKQVTERVTDHR